MAHCAGPSARSAGHSAARSAGSFPERTLLANASLVPRRRVLKVSVAGIAGLAAARCTAFSALVARGAEAQELAPLNRFPRMVQEYFVQRVRRSEQLGAAARAKLQTREDAEAYVRCVREKVRQCFGPLPEKTPLNPRITGTVEREAYRIENLIFESRPGLLVTANLYVPKGRKFPLPGVVGTCGHSASGKAAEPYQSFAQGLARLGYVVLIYDPIGQGERFQYTDENLRSRVGAGVNEHLLAGNQQFLVGEFLGTWRAWDGIRALDYLLSREEVDPQHVGVTGNSGGGTMTTWLCGTEQRWTMAAPSCFVTTFRRNLENELPADTEQCPPRALALGLDHQDFLAALAPKPVILLGKEQDYFDVRGTQAAYERLKVIYRLLGAEENVALFIGPGYHGYSPENRLAMYRWFNRAVGWPEPEAEPEIVLEKEETLWCTPRGQVAELGSRTVFSFTREKSQALAARRSELAAGALAAALSRRLRLPKREGAPDYRILRSVGARGYPQRYYTTYAVQTEPGVHAVVCRLSDQQHMSRLPQTDRPAVLYVAHHSSDAELRSEPLIRQLIEEEPAAVFYACDVRGVGESRPNTCGHEMFLHRYGSDYFYAIHAIMLDYPYVGQKTHDVLCVLDWLHAAGHEGIHLAALGWGTLPAVFAAVLSERVSRVTLKHALSSYAEVAETEIYGWPLSALLPGVLEELDLPDCYRLLENKKLRIIEPKGAAG